MSARRFLSMAALGGVALALATPATAAGCNGVVDIFKWGCAPWDNNNGAQFPYYQAPRVTLTKKNAKIEMINGARYVTDLRSGARMPLIQDGGTYVVAAGAGN